ncbi:FAD-dependent oxidoreductase [Verminephrobacter eiseniae]|uniref:Fumarate reductase/succinate dehydrogenase flavoprotein domain protein n=1 Tax=Verminephrobacter eiseniae (strain EF01-2) TaxID=391735 RepID=A1WJ61_VEREI|nr:FAD-dependent oxidoreductase [Verminephrobacter eiseniae]ABM57668.1 fumarate reductase/succinate dehydrogenase flavoprotein domain protein [Verminephrobacter eiseniae EF01-2]MCW5283286.1 FAD-dependent oxidoreductase [Verminephrobacter eiseniae]MCW5303602.1 FAD-dependent oxidoreductase [Verminephrobacter eiseniae]MCW8178167.1 FAD-dependent oxidoreductase [Verminephrobacter eiseniae]MCW8188396.1 FAD-dependent oxidoreductase [Verminephrobacter eiseniae]
MNGPLRTMRRAARVEADVHVAVAIVGGGACGLTAALMLHDAGVDCVVLERDALPSGSTALSSGFIPAPGTRAQRAHGVTGDSAARFAADIQAKARGRAAPALVDAYATAIGPALDALQQRHGLEWLLLDGFLYPGHSVRRMHALPQKTGRALMAVLHAAAGAAGIPILTQAVVDTLVLDSAQRVLGIDYLRPDGRRETLGCAALLLACNGFGGNAQMVRTLLPEMAEARFCGHVGNDGSAIAWGRSLGARLRDLGGYQGHGSWVTPHGALMSWAVMMAGAVQVNGAGQRFHDETQGYSEAALHVLAQPQGIAWNLFDAPLLALARSFPDFCEAEAAGALRRCPSVAALADCIGCKPSVLQRTLDTVRAASAAPDGRVFARGLDAPYFAVKVTGALFHTQGGLDTAPDMRVLRRDGTPLANLLAAGGAAGGVSGDAASGYLSGNGLLSAVAGGYIAARTATTIVQSREAPTS